MPDTVVCVCIQEKAAKPLAAVAAVASHRLLSVATQTLGSQLTQRSANGDRGDDSLALSALTALKALAAGSAPILDAPVASTVLQLTHQLLDKVHIFSRSPYNPWNCQEWLLALERLCAFVRHRSEQMCPRCNQADRRLTVKHAHRPAPRERAYLIVGHCP